MSYGIFEVLKTIGSANASINFFSRLGRFFRGFLGLSIKKLEEDNYEALFEDIKIEIENARKETEQKIVEILTSAELIKIEMKNVEKNLETIKLRIKTAQKQKDTELLTELLIHEEQYMAIYDAHKNTYDNTLLEVAKIKEDYKIFESEMHSKLNELKTLKSQAKIAILRENINSVNLKYNSKNNKMENINSSMERAREIINIKTAKANAVESLGESNIDTKIKRLDAMSVRDKAKIRAEAMLNDEEGFTVKESIKPKISLEKISLENEETSKRKIVA